MAPNPWPAAGALAFSAVVTGWLALALLAHVLPALFPGQALPIQAPLPGAFNAVAIQPPGAQSVFNKPIVILAAAVDSRPNQPQDLASVNTDTIMLVRLDPVAKDVRVLSVPRDLWIDLTYPDGTTGDGRINSSFALGASEGRGAAAGMDNLAKDLERDLDVPIDYWVQVDFRGAERIIDAIGGVDVEIPANLAMTDWWYSDDDVSHRLLSFPPGKQHLDGYHAVAFARLRAPDDDLHRIKRQQLVLEAVVSQAFSGGAMNDPVGLWNAYGNAFRTNVPLSRIPGFALLAKQTRGAMRTYSLGDPVQGAPAVEDRTLRSGAEVLLPVPAAVAYWVEQVLGSDAGEGGDVARTGP